MGKRSGKNLLFYLKQKRTPFLLNDSFTHMHSHTCVEVNNGNESDNKEKNLKNKVIKMNHYQDLKKDDIKWC